jgi:phosphatidylethanolamine-binding protein (PEBP) family uncharacterized protein
VCRSRGLPSPSRGSVARRLVHWVIYGLSAARTGLDEAEAVQEARSGANGLGQPGYLGPAPPAGHGVHHYVFRLLALDQAVTLNGQPSYAEVEAAASGHVLAEARLIGT